MPSIKRALLDQDSRDKKRRLQEEEVEDVEQSVDEDDVVIVEHDEEDEDEDEDEEVSMEEVSMEEDSAKQSKERKEQEKTKKNKQRVMVLASRGINYRHRHLLQDILALLPQSKKESKLDTKSNLFALNELAELNNCNNTLYFEARRHTDLYMWLSKTPNGPSVKFQVTNIHTMDELHLTGNHLKGSRPIVSFDATFDTEPHYKVLKELFTQSFAVPPSSRKIKPFFDHVFSFSILDGKIWFRNYQILKKDTGDELSEVGPRFVLDIVRIFDGSFCGSTLYENPHYTSPTQLRRMQRQAASGKYNARQESKLHMEKKRENSKLDQDPLDEIFRE